MSLAKLRASVVSHISRVGTHSGVNIVAFSGGVDSSLAAALVHEVFPSNTVAVTAVSPSLPHKQRLQAQEVARAMGVAFEEVWTHEHKISAYRANEGESCYHCKKTLYAALSREETLLRTAKERGKVELFNGTNKEDLADLTRVGLVAAREFAVHSPLRLLSKLQVREWAKELGLPNHDLAAAPCLRSRLARGVEASEEHLRLVERAEFQVQQVLRLRPQENMRVRLLARERFRIEVDESRIEDANRLLDKILERWEVDRDRVELAPFKTGSVAVKPPANFGKR